MTSPAVGEEGDIAKEEAQWWRQLSLGRQPAGPPLRREQELIGAESVRRRRRLQDGRERAGHSRQSLVHVCKAGSCEEDGGVGPGAWSRGRRQGGGEARVARTQMVKDRLFTHPLTLS